MLYDDLIDKKETMKIAKKVLKEYSSLLRYLDNEIYEMSLSSSWNIGRIPLTTNYVNNDQLMLSKLAIMDTRNKQRLEIINRVQLAISKLSPEEIEIFYYLYVKQLSNAEIEVKLMISERQRRRITNKAYLSFGKAYNIEQLLKQ